MILNDLTTENILIKAWFAGHLVLTLVDLQIYLKFIIEMRTSFLGAIPRKLARNTSRKTIRRLQMDVTNLNPGYTPSVRFYATSRQSSNVSNPVASSPESQAINKARGLEGRHSDTADTRSTQSPISSSNKGALGSETHEGEEQTPTDAQIKNDPNKPTEVKRKNVENAGKKPLGPEDHQ